MSTHGHSISNPDLTRLRTLIYSQAGINMGPDKKTMLELRIRHRMRSLEIDSFADYCEFLFSRRGQSEELIHFLDAVTTNKTDFFREPNHFAFLTKSALPMLDSDCGHLRPLLVWCAGCSTGEEAYTLAMVLSEYAHAHSGFRFKILATDICTRVLDKANRAIYQTDDLSPVPAELRRKYFVRSRDRGSNLVRVVPELRDLIEFRRLNFMENDYAIGPQADVIFCRNVIIYFDRTTQEQVLRKLVHHLAPGGHLFLGHSETLHGLDVSLAPVAPALYRKPSHG
jgi:chemotaxis protein methyltransferase CheR